VNKNSSRLDVLEKDFNSKHNEILVLLNDIVLKDTKLIRVVEEANKIIKIKDKVLEYLRDIILVLFGAGVAYLIELIVR